MIAYHCGCRPLTDVDRRSILLLAAAPIKLHYVNQTRKQGWRFGKRSDRWEQAGDVAGEIPIQKEHFSASAPEKKEQTGQP